MRFDQTPQWPITASTLNSWPIHSSELNALIKTGSAALPIEIRLRFKSGQLRACIRYEERGQWTEWEAIPISDADGLPEVDC